MRSARHSGTSVLIVDDDCDARELVGRALSKTGMRVTEATNGLEALRLLLSQTPLPSVMLVDLEMPVMAGWEFLEARSSYPRLATIPVLISSASGDIRTTNPRTHGAVAGYLPKPVDLTALPDLLTGAAARTDCVTPPASSERQSPESLRRSSF